MEHFSESLLFRLPFTSFGWTTQGMFVRGNTARGHSCRNCVESRRVHQHIHRALGRKDVRHKWRERTA